MWVFMRTISSWMSLRSASSAASCMMRSGSACAPISSCMRVAPFPDKLRTSGSRKLLTLGGLLQVLQPFAQFADDAAALFLAHVIQLAMASSSLGR